MCDVKLAGGRGEERGGGGGGEVLGGLAHLQQIC